MDEYPELKDKPLYRAFRSLENKKRMHRTEEAMVRIFLLAVSYMNLSPGPIKFQFTYFESGSDTESSSSSSSSSSEFYDS
jgi:hypothetical protein